MSCTKLEYLAIQPRHPLNSLPRSHQQDHKFLGRLVTVSQLRQFASAVYWFLLRPTRFQSSSLDRFLLLEIGTHDGGANMNLISGRKYQYYSVCRTCNNEIMAPPHLRPKDCTMMNGVNDTESASQRTAHRVSSFQEFVTRAVDVPNVLLRKCLEVGVVWCGDLVWKESCRVSDEYVPAFVREVLLDSFVPSKRNWAPSLASKCVMFVESLVLLRIFDLIDPIFPPQDSTLQLQTAD